MESTTEDGKINNFDEAWHVRHAITISKKTEVGQAGSAGEEGGEAR